MDKTDEPAGFSTPSEPKLKAPAFVSPNETPVLSNQFEMNTGLDTPIGRPGLPQQAGNRYEFLTPASAAKAVSQGQESPPVPATPVNSTRASPDNAQQAVKEGTTKTVWPKPTGDFHL